MQRTSTKVAALLGALLLIIFGAALLSGRSAPTSEEASQAHGTTAAPSGGAQASSGPSSAPTGPEESRPPKELLPMPLCWQGLGELDKNVSFDTIRQALDAAVAGPDRYLAGYLQERLTELIGNDVNRALQVVAWAEKAQAPYLGVFIEALKASDAVHNPKVVDALLKIGEDKGALLINRGAVLDALDTQKRLGPAQIQRVKALALDESLDSTSWLATRTIGKVMKEDFERTGTFAPYWKELMDLSEKSDDMAVRLLALEMPSYSNPILDGDSIDRLSKIMTTDRERDVREMAAFRLAVTEEPEKALEAYRNAFPTEQDECVRWALFRFAVRAAGPKALPLLQQFAAQDPRFVADYQNFQRLYAEGTVDFSRIWLGVEERHECLMEEGAPH
ncbi:HEAT repeat domain-containing protein [Archangium gephyra]|uniref:HEAT repeat domain-containing protein n=1 Tax=Archangium gephyra TaxID=48 RepID=UPI003B81346B